MLDKLFNALEAFHLLRPIWALCFPLILFIWWQTRKKHNQLSNNHTGIAEHLAKAMSLQQRKSKCWQAIDTTALALALLIFAACGPSWNRVASPFESQTAPLVVIMEITSSMQSPDFQPSRLERAKYKVLDLIKERSGARTALIAYAGSAHRVAPLSEDPQILQSMIEALSPEIMPLEGSNLRPALEMAQMELSGSATPGSILVVSDGIESTDIAALTAEDEQSSLIVLLATPNVKAHDELKQSKARAIVPLSADDSDIQEIVRHVNSSFEAASLANNELEWEDKGWLFAWPAALLIALWFRRGWTVDWSLLGKRKQTSKSSVSAIVILCGLSFGLFSPTPAHANALDLFLTQDQQGMLSYQQQNYQQASDVFQDPLWRAQSLMKQAKFEEAADIFSRIDLPEAAFAEGYCWQQAQRFKQSIRAYERALILRPEYADAEHNLLLTRAIVKLLKPVQQEDREGDQSGGGKGNPDDFGDVQLSSTKQMSSNSQAAFTTAEEWMRAVDTDMSEFLKVRFAMEAQEKKL